MASQGVSPAGPAIGVVVSSLQYIANSAGTALERVGLATVGRFFKFVFIPNSTGGGTIATTTASVAVTAAHNTSPLWMPLFMEATLGKPAAWLAITFFGIPNAPGYVLVGVGAMTYMLFTSTTNAIQWAFNKGPEKVEEIMENLRKTVQDTEALVQKKQQELEDINQKINIIIHTHREHQEQYLESLKENGGTYDEKDPEKLALLRFGAEDDLNGSKNYMESSVGDRFVLETELAEAIKALADAKQKLEEAEAAKAQKEQENDSLLVSSSDAKPNDGIEVEDVGPVATLTIEDQDLVG